MGELLYFPITFILLPIIIILGALIRVVGNLTASQSLKLYFTKFEMIRFAYHMHFFLQQYPESQVG